MKITTKFTTSFMTKLSASKVLKSNISKLLIAFIVVASMVSCNKEAGKIGATLMPEDSRLNADITDTTTVYAYSVLSDSVRSDELQFNLLGSIADPEFGLTTAGFYSQVTLSSLNQDFGPNPVLDSLVLQLSYDGYYGDTNVYLQIHAYELKEFLEIEDNYYSNVELQTGDIDYLNFSFAPTPNDSSTVIDEIAEDTTKIGAIERFRLSDLDPGLGNYLLSADSAAMSNSVNFSEFFNGLYLTSDEITNKGCLVKFDLTDTKSGLILYYKNDTADSLRYSYPINGLTPRVSKYTHNYDYAAAHIRNQIIEGDTSWGQREFYTQGLGGIKAVIKFPHLVEWARQGKIALNEAKIYFTQTEDDPYYDPPLAMLLVKRLEDDSQELIIDQYEGGTYFGGEYMSSNKQYVFRLTNHLQQLLLDTTIVDYGLYMYTNASSINPKRMILNGNNPVNDSTTPLKVEFIYTNLN